MPLVTLYNQLIIFSTFVVILPTHIINTIISFYIFLSDQMHYLGSLQNQDFPHHQ